MKKILLLCFLLVTALLQQAMAQVRTITGKVTDASTSQPLPGVTVLVKGTTVGTATGGDGSYTVNVPQGGTTLVFRFIGYATTEREIGNATTVNVGLGVDSKQLSEVVIVGAGGIERQVKEQGYNTTTIKTQELTQGKTPNIATGLTGKVAGLQINAIGSGVNPNVRVTLRGMRSLTGNNEALIVLDNVIVPNEVLGNLNPEDIDAVTVLNGGNAAALYGSDASNGAILITTKKGKAGVNSVTVSHTTTLEEISFFPKLQNKFGSGSAGGEQTYVPYENQQYGPAFDGSMVQIGKPLADGSIQTVPYSARNDKYDFWDTGVQNQTDFSLSSGNDKSTFYVAGQRLDVTGTTPGDKFDRTSVRINASHDLGNKLKLNFNSNYTQNNYDITTQTANMFDALLQTPAHIPLTQYKDWRNNPYANPNGYYNEYYDNPYFLIDNYRQDVRNNYLIGNAELKYAPLNWLDLTYRVGITNRVSNTKNKVDMFTLSDYTKGISSSKYDEAGSVSDNTYNSTQLNSDFLAQFTKDVNDFSFKVILGQSIRSNYSKSIGIYGNGLVNPGLFNISNRVGEPGASEGNYEARQIGVFGDATIGFKDYLFLHFTGRNDWTSILAKENRSFFYPSVDIAFTATEAISALRDNEILNHLKLRAGWSKVGQVNLTSSRTTFGAYQLQPTFAPTGGFPYGSLTGYSLDDRIVSPNLKPEMTTGYEYGFDASFLNDLVSTKFTYYQTNTVDQTVATGVSRATGYSSYLVNTGETQNRGVEASLNVTPINTETWGLTLGGNYTYNKGEVLSISSDLDNIQLSTGGNAQVYAVAGQAFPVIMGTDYVRDEQGRIIVDRVTGYPTAATGLKMLGHTEPLHRLGLNIEARFKSFRFTSLFEHRGNFYRYHNGGSTFDFSGSSARSAQYNRDRFVIPNSSFLNPETGQYEANTNITVQDGGAGFFANGDYNMSVASNYVTRGDYWRWREASLSYDLPTSILGAVKFVKAASISVQARNLKLWLPESNQYTDPDYNFSDGNAIGITTLGQTPPTRYYGATVSVTF
ncbi:SusC/RagA family TonB-linked outer membrane protein [Pontibacter liquoris]|uniref:SusC/RagA family TonB-linked outer membrane protein n=1 Tax=Pontibacter liquoris TaxID=2905677 RepID=UPI001FA7B0B7|nr:SusC/RagA family TonB-linked outer membrane protein [Pontibacter liquoris]